MRLLVVGYGIQGAKRQRIAGESCVGIVDPVSPQAQHKDIRSVPLDSYDGALVCVPDEPKFEIVHWLVSHGKHVLVEKPLWTPDDAQIGVIEAAARQNGAVCYTAYNHRFEPHFAAMRTLLQSGTLGRIYRCRMFYGNGTARLVRDSAWRDRGGGVVPDLASHLIDTVQFWFGDIAGDYRVVTANRFENAAPDHAVIVHDAGRPSIELEMTLLSWRNHFTCDILAENGTAHIRSLCKWGPSSLTVRRRVLPSGRPLEETTVLVRDDPTWALEYEHFLRLCHAAAPADLSWDRRLNGILRELSAAAQAAS